MQLTIFGLLIFVVGVYLLLARRVEAMFAFVMICTLMGGSAAVVVTALGGASISPAHLALGFLIVRILAHRGVGEAIKSAFLANIAFVIFAAYAAAGAFALPRIFRDQLDVVPMRPAGLRSLFDAFPLEPTSQNVTTAVYIIGTLLLAMCAYVAARQAQGAVRFVKTACVLVAIHCALGIASAVAGDTVIGRILALFRNGSYAQVEQQVGGFVRIAGIFPEASAYASYSVGWLALMTELWFRDILPRRTGPMAALMAAVLICSTSSTAYLSLAVYAALIVVRLLLFPNFLTFRKFLSLATFCFAAVLLACLFLALKPALAQTLLSVLERMTVAKAGSDSGLQRAFWAKQGLTAFVTSHGLGIGAGSFRSSSIMTAIIGSVGVIGTTAFVAYLARIVMPLRSSTYFGAADPVEGVGVAASWAALVSLVPQAVSGPSPDPGLLFAILAGVSLGLRRRTAEVRSLGPLRSSQRRPALLRGRTLDHAAT